MSRLVTTLLNPQKAPALTLIELSHERWEIELVIDEIKTHERAQRKVLRSKTPEGVKQELYGIFLAHYLVRALMAQGALQAELDPDRLSCTEGLFHLSEMIDLALMVEAEATAPLLQRLYEKLTCQCLPERRLRINRREVKQVYTKYKPKKRHLPPPKPFEPDAHFLDFVDLLDPLCTSLLAKKEPTMYPVPTPEYAHQGIHMLYFLIMNDTRPRHIQKGIDHVERDRASFAENVAATRAGVYR